MNIIISRRISHLRCSYTTMLIGRDYYNNYCTIRSYKKDTYTAFAKIARSGFTPM